MMAVVVVSRDGAESVVQVLGCCGGRCYETVISFQE